MLRNAFPALVIHWSCSARPVSWLLVFVFCFVFGSTTEEFDLSGVLRSHSSLAFSRQLFLRWQSPGTEASLPDTAVAQLGHVFISREIWGEAKLITGLEWGPECVSDLECKLFAIIIACAPSCLAPMVIIPMQNKQFCAFRVGGNEGERGS